MEDSRIILIGVIGIVMAFIVLAIAMAPGETQFTNPAIRFMNSDNVTVTSTNGNVTWIVTNITASAGVSSINGTTGAIGLLESAYINITKTGQNFLFELLGNFVNSFKGLTGVITASNSENVSVVATGNDLKWYVKNVSATSGVSSLNGLTGALIVGNYSTAVTSLNGLSGDLTVVNSSSGTWTNFNNNPVMFDDFIGGAANSDGYIGELGWSKSGTGSHPNGETNYPGIQRMTTSATLNSDANLRLGNGEVALYSRDPWNCTFIFRFGANISNIEFRAGFSSGITSDTPTSHIVLQYVPTSNINFTFRVQNGGSNYTETTDVTPGASTWYVIEIVRVSATEYTLYINDVLKATNSHGPATSTGVGFGINIKNKYAVAKSFDLDYFRLQLTSLSRNPHSYDTGLMLQGPAPAGNRTDGYYLNDGSFVNFNPNRQSILLFSDLTGCQMTAIGQSYNEICPEITRIKIDAHDYSQLKLYGVYTTGTNLIKIQLEGSLNGVNWIPILTSPPLPSNTRKYVESDWFILDPDYQKEGYIRLTIGNGSGTQSATIFKIGLMLR